MSMQPQWSKYEIVLLIEAYINIKNTSASRTETLENLSQKLRMMAQKNGTVIDDTYRNLNGMRWQYAFIEKAFAHSGFGEHMPPKLFQEMVNLYESDAETFNRILLVAHEMCTSESTNLERTPMKEEHAEMTDNKTDFIKWLQAQSKHKYPIGLIVSVQSECSDYAKNHSISKISFWEMTDQMQYKLVAQKLMGMRLFRVTHRKAALAFDKTHIYYSEYLGEKNRESTEPVKLSPKIPGQSFQFDVTKKTDTLDAVGKDSSTESLLEQFSVWLSQEKQMSANTVRSYLSSLNSIASYCLRENIISEPIISIAPDKLQEKSLQILRNADFQKYNAEQHNRFSAALKKLVEFRTGLAWQELKKSASTEAKTNAKHPFREQVKAIMKDHYAYGFRYDSAIDIKRFRRYAESDGIALPESDDSLRAEIKNIGVKIEDKIYLFEEDIFRFIRSTIDALSRDGSTIIFYEQLYNLNSAEMEKHFILSVEMLKAIMKSCRRSIFDAYIEPYFAQNFLSLSGNHLERDAVTSELQRVWGEAQTRKVQELVEQLPAIPEEYVKRYLAGSTDFVWVSEGVYFGMICFKITEEEEEKILDFVTEECSIKGYASISDVPLGNTGEENYELTSIGLQEAIYNRVLIGKFHLNGKILTKEKSDLDVVTLASQYLANKDECFFDELDAKVIKLAGNRYRYMTYQALYDSMIRTDKTRYVADRYVMFDIEAIDDLLSNMIIGDFIAIKEITSFALFPMCGQPWNHYLLESYCYSYSKQFQLKVLGFNDKNAGAIVKKTVTYGYNELLARAAAQAKIELTPQIVGKYYFDTGFMGKSKFADLEAIVERAKAIREGL